MEELEAGRIIGSYRVVRCIGQGGMGTVYEVEHVELGVRYALKTFTFDPADEHAETLKTKFLEEGKVLARLKHPNIAHVFDLAFDEQSQLPYFVMDLVTYEDGESYTAEDVEPADIDEELVLQWFSEVAAALDYIHGEGIVHRDVKPGNLLLGKGEHVVLTDFGISRVFGKKMQEGVHAEKTMVTTTGRGKVVLGTEKYMAPEVAAGEEATPAADAYALGVMALRWLTGFYYADNPGCIALLAHKKYKWLPVIAQLVAPVGRRPDNLSVLVKKVKGVGEGEKRGGGGQRKGKSSKKKNEWGRAILIAFFVLVGLCGAAWFGYQGWLHYEADKKTQRERYEEIQRQLREKEEAEKKKEEAEAKRIADEKAKKDAEKKAAAAKKEKEEAERVVISPPKDGEEKVKGKGQGQERTDKPSKKRTFEDEGNVAKEEKDYGPIPDRKYTWLRGGDADAPMQEHFLLANGATIELMPFKAATFYMTNEENDPKGWHEVTLTRPFWMSKSCVTVDQWREFAPNDCEDCREVEKALNGQALLYIRLPRKSIDEYCAYLTAKYRVKLPKGYVFRLPTEAEWEYAMDWEAVVAQWDQPGIRNCWENVSNGGMAVKERFAPIRDSQKVLQQIREDTWWEGHRYRVGGLAMSTPSGILDVFGEWRWMLDRWPHGKRIAYVDVEVDPLYWQKTGMNDALARQWERAREGRSERDQNLCHIVVGPDLIGEEAWKNKRENIVEARANVPRQAKKFDPKTIPNKIKKPREIALKRVGGKEMVFCEIPKGKFNMSNVDGQAKQYHKVELTKPFWMSKFLVTSEEWREYAPADFKTRAVKAAERLFPKNPVCVNNPYHRWTAYCEFLTQRYGHLLPPGYVFRLPTEAEWEWAFIADEKGDVRRMSLDFCNDNERLRKEFDVMMKKAHAPKELRYDNLGFIGNAYIGGRTLRTGFGVYDFAVHGWARDPVVLDTFDTSGRPDDGWKADPSINICYQEKEVDPIRYAGRCAGFMEERSLHGGRGLINFQHHPGCAHIVIAPDILKPLKEKEVAEFPMEDFGGVFLGDSVTRADQSSKSENWRNTDEQFKRMVSRENVIVARFDKGEDTRGFHTGQEDAPWIMLDLGKVHKITGLAIDGFYDRARHLCVWGSHDGKKRTLLDKEDLERKRYRIDLQKKNAKFRYLIIGREPDAQKNQWFYLDKIVVYGK